MELRMSSVTTVEWGLTRFALEGGGAGASLMPGLDRNILTSTQLAQDGPSAGMISRPEDMSCSPAVCGAETLLLPSLITSLTCGTSSAVCTCSIQHLQRRCHLRHQPAPSTHPDDIRRTPALCRAAAVLLPSNMMYLTCLTKLLDRNTRM